MRFGWLAPACMVLIGVALTAAADHSAPKAAASVEKEFAAQPRRVARSPRFLSFRSIAAQVDNQVIANLLADAPVRANEIVISATAGEASRCEARTCQVPMSVRVEGAQGLVTMTFAVATPKGQLSDVQHVECNTGDCVVSLILERGQNTISVGVLDGLAQATGYTTMRINATRSVADRGKSEWF